MQPKALLLVLLGGCSVVDIAMGMPKAGVGAALETVENPHVTLDKINTPDTSYAQNNALLVKRADLTVLNMPGAGEVIYRTIHFSGVAMTLAFRIFNGFLQARLSSGPLICEIVHMGVNIAAGRNPTAAITLDNHWTGTGMHCLSGDTVSVSNGINCPP